MKAFDPWKLEENTHFGASAGATSGSSAQARGIKYHQKFYRTLRMQATLYPNLRVLIEPWFINKNTRRLRSPDAVLIDDLRKECLVIEAKMNWKDGRDRKLIDEYLPIAASAFEMKSRPLLVTGNVRGLQHSPVAGLGAGLEAGWGWMPGQPTPVALVL